MKAGEGGIPGVRGEWSLSVAQLLCAHVITFSHPPLP